MTHRSEECWCTLTVLQALWNSTMFGNIFKKKIVSMSADAGELKNPSQPELVIDDNLLALYMGYAFSHAVNVQHLLSTGELTVPYVVYWKGKEPTPVPYPAPSQQEAVDKAHAARTQYSDGTGWSSGRECVVDQGNGTKLDGLFIEGWVPSLDSPLELLVYYRTGPFRLIHAFMWKPHPQARKDGHAFMAEFKRGILLQPFGQQCMELIDHAEPFK